ncbi:MAG: ATP synthase F1 subunit gamma [Myxococcota bacterium]
MATLRDIRNRITAVEKTQKITRAMKMVAAAKLARAQNAINAARPYAEKMQALLASVASGADPDAHRLLVRRESVRKLDVVLFTSDRGLCGAYNANLIKHAERLSVSRRPELDSLALIPVGRRGGEYFQRRGAAVPRHWEGLRTITPEFAAEIADYLIERFESGEADEVVLVYSEFQSALTQHPGDEILLPVQPGESHLQRVYEMEPGPEALLGMLVPRAVEFAVFRALLENQAGEHGARMTAMDNATNNTEELIRTLTLDFNKARQAAITSELVEIVSGAEAL